MTQTLIVSSSFNHVSRSNRLAQLANDELMALGCNVAQLQLNTVTLPDVSVPGLFESEVYRTCNQQVQDADALILASPVYNWSICAEMKKFIEVIGSTNSDHPSPLFNKLVSFIFAAGLPHSYMALQSAATSLMLDFKCIINPHQAYLHNRHWTESEELTSEGASKLQNMITAHCELSARLKGLSLARQWQV